MKETAEFFNTTEVILPNIAHDIQLDTNWRQAAQVLLNWINTTVVNE